MTRANDVRKSQFTAVSSLQSGDYLDIVRNGQNFKISYTDFLTAIGVTGSLSSLGEVAAIPILNIIANVNYIRKLIGGSGIVASLSPGNGIQLDQNFTVDKTGSPIMINESAASPVFRSIQAGSGISVGAAGNVIQISTAAVPGTSKTIYVYDISDLPAPVAGVITLADDTEYLFQNDVSSGYRYVLGAGTVISSVQPDLIEFEYTGAGIMFTANDKSCYFKGIHLKCSSGTLFDIVSSTGLHRCGLTDIIGECSIIGTIDGLESFSVSRTNFIFGSDGIVFANAFTIARFQNTAFIGLGAGVVNAVDLGTATFDYFSITQGFWNMDAGAICLEGAAASANINAGGIGIVAFCTQFGSGTFLNTLSPYDLRWEFQSNTNAENSADVAIAYHNAGTVTIPGAATPTIVGTAWVAVEMDRFTHAAGGRWTYNGRGKHCNIDFNICGTSASSTHTFRFWLYKNGVVIPNSNISRSFAGTIDQISLHWLEEIENGDYIEVWVENVTGTPNFSITKATIRFS